MLEIDFNYYRHRILTTEKDFAMIKAAELNSNEPILAKVSIAASGADYVNYAFTALGDLHTLFYLAGKTEKVYLRFGNEKWSETFNCKN